MIMKKIIFSILAISSLAACKKSILEKVDFAGVDDETVWNNESTATLYLNNLYSLVIPVWPSSSGNANLPTGIHNTSDESNGGNTALLYGTLTVDNVTDFYGSGGVNNAYGYLRKINTLLTQIDNGSLTADVKNKIKGQAYFLRAWVYFQLVKLYGGVPYITKPQDWVTDNLMVPRNKTSECIDSMVADLDKGAVLPGVWSSNTDRGRITRGAALAVKGKVLLFWASPQFNPGNDASRWEKAYQANRAAYDTLVKDGYALYSDFSKIFIDANNPNDREPILFRSYNGTSATGLYNNYDNVTRPYSETNGGGGQNNPTWDLVKAFPMKDGKAITDATGKYPYSNVYYWKNRDPRFAATIAYNGCVWELSSKAGRRQWNYTGVSEDKSKPTVTGFYCRKNIDPSMLAANANFGKTFWVEIRLAEVMLNLAECANATGRQQDAYAMLTAIRKRAGIEPGSDNLYGLKAGMTQTEMNNAILQERRVELAFEGKRYDDLRRTRTFDKLNGTKRMALIIAPRAPYTVKDLEAKDAAGIMLRDKLNIDGTDYTTYFTATEQPISGENAINYLSVYYFYAIPTTNITKNPAMLQTQGWANGSFDPLQ
jgi:hypothetical protein